MSLSHPVPTSSDDVPPPAAGTGGQVERQPRTNLFLTAQLSLPTGELRTIRIRNLSTSGAKIEIADPPTTGTRVRLGRGAVQVAAVVVWDKPGCCGLRFDQMIEVARWMSDRPVAAAAAAVAVAVPTVVVKHEPSLADDLALARQLLDRLEDALAADPGIVAALGTELQGIDLLGQLLRTSEKRAAGSIAPQIRSLWHAAATFLRRPPYGSGSA